MSVLGLVVDSVLKVVSPTAIGKIDANKMEFEAVFDDPITHNRFDCINKFVSRLRIRHILFAAFSLSAAPTVRTVISIVSEG